MQDAEDLSFKKNDILVVVEQNEEKWWTAIDEHGNKGLIPEPYVKKVCNSSAIHNNIKIIYTLYSALHESSKALHNKRRK